MTTCKGAQGMRRYSTMGCNIVDLEGSVRGTHEPRSAHCVETDSHQRMLNIQGQRMLNMPGRTLVRGCCCAKRHPDWICNCAENATVQMIHPWRGRRTRGAKLAHSSAKWKNKWGLFLLGLEWWINDVLSSSKKVAVIGKSNQIIFFFNTPKQYLGSISPKKLSRKRQG